MCHCTEYELSALQARISEKNTINATTQQFITAKISGFCDYHIFVIENRDASEQRALSDKSG